MVLDYELADNTIAYVFDGPMDEKTIAPIFTSKPLMNGSFRKTLSKLFTDWRARFWGIFGRPSIMTRCDHRISQTSLEPNGKHF